MSCLNLSNKEVKAAVDEVAKVLGSEDAAYYVISENNGYSIDRAPNGEPSELFSALLSHFQGDRNATILAKSKVFTEAFKTWFGDWLRAYNSGSRYNLGESTGSTDIKQIINEDGTVNFDKLEEVTDQYFNTEDESLFKKGRKTLRTRKEHHPGENNTLEHLQNVVKSANNIDIRSDLKPQLILAAALHDLGKPFHGGQLHGFHSLQVINKVFKGDISDLVKFAVKHHMLTTEEEKTFSQEDANRIVQDILDNNLNPQDAIELLLAVNTADIVMGMQDDDIDRYTNKTKKETIEEEIPFKRQLLENALNNLTVSKVVDKNGEPLVVYHGTRTSDGIEKEGFSSNMSGKGNRGANQGYFYFSNNYENAEYTGVKNEEIEPLIDLITSVYDMFDTTELPSTKELYTIVDDLIKEKRKINDNIRNLKEDSIIKKLIKPILKLTNKDYKSSKELKEQYRNTINEIDIELEELDTKIKNIYNLNLGLDYLKGDRSKTSVNTLYFIKSSINSKSPYRQIAANKLINILYGTKNLKYSPKVFPVYLNIKNPLSSDFGMKETDKNPLKSGPFSEDYILYNNLESGLLKELTKPEYDGSISRNKFDILFGDVYIAKHSNQIKSIDNQGTFSTEDNNIHHAEQQQPLMYQYHPAEEFTSFYVTNTGFGTATSGELVARLSDYLTPGTQAYRLLSLFKDTDIPITFKRLGTEPKAVYMEYAVIPHTITINVDKFNTSTMADNAESIMHELVHAYTSRTLLRIKHGKATAEEKELYDKLVSIHKRYSEKYAKKKYVKEGDKKADFHGTYYGLQDIDEFAAELLTNPEFMTLLKTGFAPEDSFWSKLKALAITWVKSRLHIMDTEPREMYDDLYDLLTYNVQNEVTEQDFIDTNTDLLIRQEKAVHNIEEALRSAKDDFDTNTHSITQGILQALKARLQIYRNSDPVIEQQTKKVMEWQITNITQNLVSEYESINNFLKEAQTEIRTVCESLVKAKKTGVALSNERLNDLNEDFFSFYCDLIDGIVERLGYREEYRDIIGKDKEGHYRLDTLLNRARNYQTMLNEGKLLVKSQIALNASKILKDVGVEVGAVVIYRYDQNDQETYTKDISAFSWIFGAGDKIKDEAIKSIFYMINKANDKTRQQTYAKQSKLKALLNKINKYNQMQFFEVDDNGNSTGYFVRSRNYGKFEKAYKAEMDRICKSLGIDTTDLNLPENRQIRIEYNKQRNKWLSEHCERRFTAEYYEAFNHLSSEAQAQRENIQVSIRNLTNKGRDEYGIFRIERLKPEERKQLKQYQLQKKQLANIYDIYGRKKTGIQLQVAQELTELNQKLSKGLLYTRNSEAYEKEKERIMSSKTLSDEEKQEWLELNSREQYKEEFYDQLKRLAKKNYGEEYAALSDRRRALLAMFRDDYTGEINAEMMPPGTKQALSAISRRMTQIRKLKKPTATEGEFEFDEIAEVVPTKQWFIDKRRFYDTIINDDPESAELWLKANSYTIKVKNADGTTNIKTVPRSWYTKMVPKDKTLIERVANNNWMEVSDKSPYFNQAYYQAQQEHPDLKDEYWIPKKDKYDSEDRYNKVMNDPDAKALYEELLSTVAEANEAYKLLHVNPYKMPQISGSVYKYMKAAINQASGLNKLTAPFRGYGQWLVDKLSIRNDDKGYNKALTKPNGERLNLIPQNYIATLDRPEAILADLIGGVMQYYQAAMEWQNKKEIQPQVELLKSHVLGKRFLDRKKAVKTGESNTARFVKAFVDMNLYDIKSQVITVDFSKVLKFVPFAGNIFNMINYDIKQPREINITKMLAILRALGTARNLALNLWCALTGTTTALFGHIVNSLVGRYYNPVNAAYALKDILVDFLINVPNKVGLTNRVSQLSQKMEYFEVGAVPELDPTNRPQLVNMFAKHWGFGIYSLSDHIIKGQILASVMKDYKLVEVDGKKKFMSREEYKKVNNLKVFKPGDVLDWNFGYKLSFDDATHVVAGELKAKDPANQAAVDAVKNQIGYLARALAQSADGQLTDLQRSVIFSHAFGQFAMMHRQYFPVILQERYTMSYQYDYQTQRYKEALLRTPFRLLAEGWEGDTRVERLLNSLKYSRRAFLNDPVARENLKKVPIEIGLWSMLYFWLVPLISSSADDDRRNWLKQLLAYVMERTTFEVMAGYNVKDMFQLIKNPSAILDYIDKMTESATMPINLMMEEIKAAFSNEPSQGDKRIKKGAYRGMTKNQKTLIELTPARNLIRLKDIKSQRDYYNNKIRGIEKKKKRRDIEEESVFNYPQ